MVQNLPRFLTTAACAALFGCAAPGPKSSPPPATMPAHAVAPATQPADPRSELPLEQVPPRPRLPRAPAAATEPSEPPLEAVELFARARIALLDDERYTAINLLEKAAALDPGSFELHYALGKLYQGNLASEERSIAALEEAASIDPNRLDLQINLGRQYLAEGRGSQGVSHLLLALQTNGYRQDGPSAAELEFFLSAALQQQGYDRAALTLLQRLSARLSHAGMAIRAKPALAPLLEHPEEIVFRIGQLHQKLGENALALAAYQAVAEHDPDNLELQRRIVQTLAATGQTAAAVDLAARFLVQYQVRDPTLTMLREAERGAGGDAAACAILRSLYREHPGIGQLLFSRINLLRGLGRNNDAEQALAEAVATHPEDPELTGQQFEALVGRGDRPAAARFLILSTTRRPEWTPEMVELFGRLLRPTSSGRLRLDDLRNLQLEPAAEPARDYWMARLESYWHRDGLARASIARALKAPGAFRPVYRLAMETIFTDGGPGADVAATQLAAKAAPHPSLAAEMRGLAFLHQREFAEAAREFSAAIKAGGGDAELELEHAEALRASGDESGFESAMWKLLSDRPMYQEGYNTLYAYYSARGAETLSDRVLSAWLGADPQSVGALRLQARDLFRANRAEAAEDVLERLFANHGDDPEVLATLQAFFTQTGRPAGLPQKLAARLIHDPGNFAAVSALTELYVAQHQVPDAVRVLGDAQSFASGDPDLLYNLSGLYARLGQKQSSEQTLRQVLRLDPGHAAAKNDLGYLLTDDGRDLPEAEDLIRNAVEAEPFNTSFLDSLGWVLYKRGRFADARKFLEQAAAPGTEVDPLVLNHLGDALYRLGDHADASRTWKKAGARLLTTGEDRDDLKGLGQLLMQKEQQSDAGQNVDVAPVPTLPNPGPQAKN